MSISDAFSPSTTHQRDSSRALREVRRIWRVKEPPPADILASLRDYPPLLARLLAYRGVTSAAEAASFLNPGWNDMCSGDCDNERAVHRHDPFLMRDMDRAVECIHQALQQKRQIAVYGDFDTDGVTAVTLLVQMFEAFDGRVRAYIPRREGEGYGLNTTAVEWLRQQGTELLVTVDCGISNVAEVRRANELGMQVVIFDHHRVPDAIPPAFAVVNPKRRDCPYPFKGLCGVGIAFKLFEALCRRYPQEYRGRIPARKLLDVVALGTIADMMPLTGENRFLVRFGLQALQETQRPGLLALMEVAGVQPRQLDATTVAFTLAPRINAAGRLEDAIDAYDLLLAKSYEEARRRAQQINETNTERRKLMLDTQEIARQLVLAKGGERNKIIMIAGEGFHHGIVGLVAGRLVEEFYRPVLVLGRGELESRGSARSIPGFNIVEALAECSDLFVKYGGHAAAAGCTILNEHLEELEQRLLMIAEQRLTDDLLVPGLAIESEATLADLTNELLDLIEQLAPFGQENSQPLFLSRRLQIVDARAVGPEGKHLKLRVAQSGGRPMDAIAFGFGGWLPRLQRRPLIDMVYNFEANEWQDARRPQLRVKDLRLSE